MIFLESIARVRGSMSANTGANPFCITEAISDTQASGVSGFDAHLGVPLVPRQFHAHLIDVEVDMYPGPRDIFMVGMPDTAVRESRERIKSSMMNSGFGYPNKAVTINLTLANIRKEGAGFDLPNGVLLFFLLLQVCSYIRLRSWPGVGAKGISLPAGRSDSWTHGLPLDR